MTNGTSIGALISIPFIPHIISYLGRRMSIVVGCFIIILGAALQGAAQSFGMFTGARVLLGIGNAITGSAAPPLITECAYPTQRPVATALLMPSWPLGSLTSALITWGTFTSLTTNWSWRIPSLLQGFFPAIQLIIAFFGPESPRWLIDKGRDKEAIDFFVKYHAHGDADHPIVQFEMAEIAATIEEEKLQKVGSWLTWFSSKAMLHRLFLALAVPAFQQLSGVSTAYYLNILLKTLGITSSTVQLKINIGLNAWILICSTFGALMVGVTKRRTLFLCGYAAMTICYTVITVLSGVNVAENYTNKALAGAVLFLIFFDQWCYQLCSPISFTYTMEISPYSMRAMTATLYQFAGNIAGLFNTYVTPVAMDAIGWKYYIVWCGWLGIMFAIVYFFFPETGDKDLEEVADTFGDLIAGRAAMEKQHRTMNKLEKTDMDFVENAV